MSRLNLPVTLALATLVLAGCQVGARHGVFEPTPAPLPPSFEGFPPPPAAAVAGDPPADSQASQPSPPPAQ